MSKLSLENFIILNGDDVKTIPGGAINKNESLFNGVTPSLKLFVEALEYDLENQKDNNKYPSFIKKLAKEVERLDKRVQKAYEDGDPEATELDVMFAVKQEQLENALSELEDEPKETDFEEQTQSGGQEELMRQFASIYHHWHENIPYQGTGVSKQDLIGFLRAWAEDYGFTLGGFKQETTDEQLLDAAADAYNRMKHILRRNAIVEKKRKRDNISLFFEAISDQQKEKIANVAPNLFTEQTIVGLQAVIRNVKEEKTSMIGLKKNFLTHFVLI
jgi:hypothetical protein